MMTGEASLHTDVLATDNDTNDASLEAPTAPVIGDENTSESNDNSEEDAASAEELEKSEHAPAATGKTDRKVSYRTETLIKEAARAVVAELEEAKRSQTNLADTKIEEQPEVRSGKSSRPQSRISQLSHASRRSHHDSGADSSSHHGDSDVFSEHSPRSSLGSLDDRPHSAHSLKSHMQYAAASLHDQDETPSRSSRTPRISNISAYDDEFIPSNPRRQSRAHFNSSDARYMHMASPEPSLFSPSSPRGSMRRRLGSPASVQYSPKNRSTPPRLKRREDQPLVLLHVTLLPLRWQWGDLVNNAEVADMNESLKGLRENWRLLQDHVGDTMLERGILLPHPQDDFEALEERLLEALELPLRRRARILECGHYLGPSNMMSLEEDESDEEFDDDSATCVSKQREKRRWCSVCRCDIKYDDLGPGKVFRIKVYASNGLMKSGAWEACWKEMERIDVELEPIIDSTMQEDLEHLAQLTQEREERGEMERERSYMHVHPPEPTIPDIEHHDMDHGINDTILTHDPLLSSPIPPMSSPGLAPSPTPTTRRRLDEERLREIYGCTPPGGAKDHISRASSPTPSHRPAPEMPADQMPAPETQYDDDPHTCSTLDADLDQEKRHPDSYIPPSSPPSPTAQAFERQQYRAQQAQAQAQAPPPTSDTTKPDVAKDVSFPELLLEAGRVALQDRRNIAIAVLSVLVLLFAFRSTSSNPSGIDMDREFQAGLARMNSARLAEMERRQQQQQQQQYTESAVVGVEDAFESVEIPVSCGAPVEDVVACVAGQREEREFESVTEELGKPVEPEPLAQELETKEQPERATELPAVEERKEEEQVEKSVVEPAIYNPDAAASAVAAAAAAAGYMAGDDLQTVTTTVTQGCEVPSASAPAGLGRVPEIEAPAPADPEPEAEVKAKAAGHCEGQGSGPTETVKVFVTETVKVSETRKVTETVQVTMTAGTTPSQAPGATTDVPATIDGTEGLTESVVAMLMGLGYGVCPASV